MTKFVFPVSCEWAEDCATQTSAPRVYRGCPLYACGFNDLRLVLQKRAFSDSLVQKAFCWLQNFWTFFRKSLSAQSFAQVFKQATKYLVSKLTLNISIFKFSSRWHLVELYTRSIIQLIFSKTSCLLCFAKTTRFVCRIDQWRLRWVFHLLCCSCCLLYWQIFAGLSAQARALTQR